MPVSPSPVAGSPIKSKSVAISTSDINLSTLPFSLKAAGLSRQLFNDRWAIPARDLRRYQLPRCVKRY